MSVAEETYELLEPETAAAYIDSRPGWPRWSTPPRSTSARSATATSTSSSCARTLRAAASC